jgi:hypothetical protein
MAGLDELFVKMLQGFWSVDQKFDSGLAAGSAAVAGAAAAKA